MRKTVGLVIILIVSSIILAACSEPDITSESLSCNISAGTVSYAAQYSYDATEGVPFPFDAAEDAIPEPDHMFVLVLVQGEPNLIFGPPAPGDEADIPVAMSGVMGSSTSVNANVTFPDATYAGLLPPVGAVPAWPVAGQQFYVIVTDEANYVHVSPVYSCTADEVETVTEPDPQWFDPGDDRINPHPGAIAVIYPASFGAAGDGLHIYRLNADGGFSIALVVTPEMLASVPDMPDEYVIIAREGDVELTKLPTGQYQVNVGPDAEGKILVTVFDDIYTGVAWQQFTVSVLD